MDARCLARRFAVCTLAASTYFSGAMAMPDSAFAQQGPTAANAAAADAPPENVSRWTSRQRSFEIPFQLAEDDTTTVVELYYSYSGEPWKMYERRKGNDGKFVFKADRDGAYWFTSRTIDAQNRPHPTGPLSAELLVIVDATPPQVAFDLVADEQGAVQCSWQIDDPGLTPQSLKLEYEVEGSWRPVAVQLPPQQMQPGTTSLRGGVTWRPETTLAATNVRLSIADAAGNLAQPIKTVHLKRADVASAANVSAPTAPSAQAATPPADATKSVPWNAETKPQENASAVAEEIATSPYQREPAKQAATVPFPSGSAEEVPTPSRTPVTTPTNAVANTPNSDTYQLPSPRSPAGTPSAGAAAGAAAVPSPTGVASADGGAYRPRNQAVSGTEGARPWNAQQDNTSQTSIYGQRAATNPPKTNPVSSGPVAGTIAPAVAKQAAQGSDESALLFGDLAVESTNATTFQLDYDVESVGPEGIAKVELWITRDRGQHWEQYSEDADRVSPIDVQINDQGLYGFRVQITGKNGLGAQPPKSGDQADIWINIDTVKPVAELSNVPYGQGPTAGMLEIYWTAEDSNLAQRPITLRYSESPTGPWTTIAASIPNDGKFLWGIEANTPKEVYLRLEVTDRAGNVGVAQLADPVRLTPLIPKARIRGFKPVSTVPLGERPQTALLR